MLRIRLVFYSVLVLLALNFGANRCQAQFSNPSAAPLSASSIPSSQLVQPAAFRALLVSGKAPKALVFQVGSHVMFGQAHIPGAIYAGPGSQPSGLDLLTSKVSSQPKDAFIVLYCGCCPWSHCPNVAGAFQRLQALGFHNVKVLYLPSNFGEDWVSKGYAVEKGS
jgi:thiosulfate/3-mercaptopyruvate sulfurtransferase